MADTVNVTHPTFAMGDRVEKISGSAWRGHVVGTYSTSLTPEGYAVESETEVGSVQIYPAKALRLATQPAPAFPRDEDIRRAGLAIQSAWNEDGDGFTNTLPPIEFSDAELRHLALAALLQGKQP